MDSGDNLSLPRSLYKCTNFSCQHDWKSDSKSISLPCPECQSNTYRELATRTSSQNKLPRTQVSKSNFCKTCQPLALHGSQIILPCCLYEEKVSSSQLIVPTVDAVKFLSLPLEPSPDTCPCESPIDDTSSTTANGNDANPSPRTSMSMDDSGYLSGTESSLLSPTPPNKLARKRFSTLKPFKFRKRLLCQDLDDDEWKIDDGESGVDYYFKLSRDKKRRSKRMSDCDSWPVEESTSGRRTRASIDMAALNNEDDESETIDVDNMNLNVTM